MAEVFHLNDDEITTVVQSIFVVKIRADALSPLAIWQQRDRRCVFQCNTLSFSVSQKQMHLIMAVPAERNQIGFVIIT